MAQPFKCACNSGEACLGQISGASHIPASTLARYFLNAHILRLKQQQLQQDGNKEDLAALLHGREEILTRGQKSVNTDNN